VSSTKTIRNTSSAAPSPVQELSGPRPTGEAPTPKARASSSDGFECSRARTEPLPSWPASRRSLLDVRAQGAQAVKASDVRPARKLGVLLTSHGDIDDPKTQLRGYVRRAVLQNAGIPLPRSVRPLIDALGWPLQRGNLLEQYAATGPTRYDENSREQAEALSAALKAKGVDARVYLGYNFLSPDIDDALRRMQADGITDIVMFNQGAQDSIATMGESIHEAEQAIAGLPDWDVRLTAVNSFSDDPRFRKLLADRLAEDAKAAFPDADPKDVLIFMTSHGLPQHLIDKGDQATKQMMDAYAEIEKDLVGRGYQVTHGYLNDDFFPGARWTGPKASERAQQIVDDVTYGKREAPKHVLLDGRLSFTVHHRATLFDANVDAREILTTPRGPAWSRFRGAEVELAPNFDGDPKLAALLAELTVEALAGRAADMRVVDP
jgi:protoheme ferro-lyase